MQFLVKILKKNPLLKKSTLLIIETIKKLYMFSINKFVGVKNNKVVFVSFNGKTYSDNPRAISEELHRMDPNMQIVWLFNNPKEKETIVPEYIKCVKLGSFKAIKELAMAKYWIDNFCKPLYIYKSKEQVYIQTWHGDRGFKKVLFDSSFATSNYRLIEPKICDLAISGSEYGDRVYKSAFRYSGEILKTGSPRNDVLIENSSIKKTKIRENLNIDSETNILLYAPTLRREAADMKALQSSKDVDLIEILDTLKKITNNNWICIVRAHSAVKGLDGILYIEKKIVDGTSYEDMSDLLLISDFLITDYSSSAGDFALLNKPIILFQPDRDEYIKKDRSFYFDLDKSPYLIARTPEEILELLYSLNGHTVSQNCKDILDFYGTVETGVASRRVAEYITT